jgi:hypothetical protein
MQAGHGHLQNIFAGAESVCQGEQIHAKDAIGRIASKFGRQ